MQKWLDTGRIASDSYVWCEGWAEWRRASEVFTTLAGILPSAQGASHPGTSGSDGQAAARQRRPSRRKSNTMAFTVITILVLASIGLITALLMLLMRSSS